MHLRITAPEEGGFKNGWRASMFLDGVDVSQWVSKVVLHVDASEPIHAEVSFYLSGLDVDMPAEIRPILTGTPGVIINIPAGTLG